MSQLKAYDIAYQLMGRNPTREGLGWKISCPCPDHPDKNPSASIWDTPSGYIGVKCHSRCDSDKPREALIAAGYIKPRAKAKKVDLRLCKSEPGGQWLYKDPDGNPHMVVKRVNYYDDNGIRAGKNVFQFKGDGETKCGPSYKRYMLNLPECIEKAKEGKVIIDVEGEPNAMTLFNAGLGGTTGSGGCKNRNGWLSAEPWVYFKGADYVAVLIDNDKPGLEYGIFKCVNYHKNGIPVKRVELPGLGPLKEDHGLDIDDWLPGHSIDELKNLIDGAPLWTPEAEPHKDYLSRFTGEQSNVVDIKPSELIFALTEKKLADFFKEHHGDDCIWVPEYPEGKRWHINNGTHFEQDAKNQIKIWVERSNEKYEEKLKQMRVDAQERDRFLRKANNRAGINNTLAMAEYRCAQNIRALDADMYAFNMLNGTLDLRTLERKNHDRRDLITRISNVNFNPKAKCPQFMEFLKQVFRGDEELMLFDQLYTGYSLTGDVGEQKLVIGYGPKGSNGKSTLSNIKLKVAGDYGRTVLAEMFLINKKGFSDVHSISLDRVVGMRMLCVLELPQGAVLNDQLLKDFTGGEQLEARPFGGKPFPFMPQGHLLFRGNLKPSAGTDPALWRRIFYVPYLHEFAASEQIKHYDDYLWEKEAEGIAFYYLQGAAMWHEMGLMIPDSVKDYTNKIKDENDPISQFAAECLRHFKDPESLGKYRTPLNTVHDVLAAWLKEQKLDYTPTTRNLKKELERLGFKVEKPSEKRALEVLDTLIYETAPKPIEGK